MNGEPAGNRPAGVAAPVRVRKVGWVLLSGDRSAGRFRGLSAPVAYTADDRARCLRERCPVGSNHTAPHFLGTCGFHGSTADPYGWMLPDTAMLDVELYGRVIRHERGWRAAGQRVLGAWFVKGCTSCVRPAREAVLVTATPQTDPRSWVVAPRCARCARVWHSSELGYCLTAGELAGLLGTEVSWLGPAASGQVLDRQRRTRAR